MCSENLRIWFSKLHYSKITNVTGYTLNCLVVKNRDKGLQIFFKVGSPCPAGLQGEE
jgi:hypothetical protein